MENDPTLEILSGLYIQSLRIYDILMLTAQKLGVDVDKLEKMHEEGKTLCPDPSLELDDDNDI
jgi:hypothetical protein